MNKRPSEAPLIGRSQELAHLVDAIDAAANGAGSVVFITGEGGVGKTRLASAAAGEAVKRGCLVASGRAYPVETGIPYAVFSDAFVPVIKRIDPAALSVLTRGTSAELAHLFPPLASPSGSNAGAGLDASELKARLLWNFSQFLGRLSAKQSLVVLLDNIQWADASSLELLHFIARQIESQKVLLICTYNETERDGNPALRATEQSLQKLGLVTVQQMQPLTAADVAELVRTTFNATADESRPFAARLYEWTRGNPFFLEETLKGLTDSGRLAERDGRWTGFDLLSFDLPPTVRDAVASRLARLTPPAKLLANLAAVLGTRASYETLRAISPTDDAALVSSIEELCRQRVLMETPGEERTSYDFTHPLLQQVLYSELGHARVTLLHGTIAEALERKYGAAALEHADELAYHFDRGRALSAKAIGYLIAAGDNALARYANREAATYFTTALDAIRSAGMDAVDGESRGRVVIGLARARQRLGEYDKALDLWAVALEHARKRSDGAAVASFEYRMGLACYWSGRHADALAHYDAGLVEAEKLDDRHSAIRLRLARGICLQELGRLDEAQQDLEFTLDAAGGELESQALLARAHRALLLLYAWTGPLDVARKHGEDALRHAAATGQPMLQWSAHWAMAILTGVSGDEPAIARHLAESAKLADESGSPILPLWSAELRVQYLSSIGDWDEGLALAERTIVLAQKQGQRALLPRLYVWAGMMYLPRGETDRARKYFDLAWTISGADKGIERPPDVPSVIPAHLGLAAYHLARGEYSQAVTVGESGLAIADRTGHAIWGLQWLLPLICEAALLDLDFVRAEALSKRMRRDATRLQHRLGLAFSDACDALLVLYRDRDPAKAISLLRSAADQFDAIPLPVQSARVRRRLAYALMDNGKRDEGQRELKRAHEVFVKLRATGELDATREALRELGVRPPSRSSIPGAAGLTGRETEIARMVAARKSNKEIGTALNISARTVSTHLSNIFLKLNVASRGELADFVREHGLAE